jgi:hypothetical protein
MAAGGRGEPAPLPPIVVPSYRSGPDSIEYTVAQLRGKTMIAALPEDFAKAVAEVKRSMRTRK